MTGGERLRAEFARGLEQVAELDRTVAFDTGHRRFAERVALGKGCDHRFAEAILVVQHIVRDADSFGDVARVVDVLARAAGALAMGRCAVVVELQRDADHVVTLRLQQRSRRRGIDAAGHGDYDAGVLWTAFEIETVEHGGYVIAGIAGHDPRDPLTNLARNFRESTGWPDAGEKLLSNIGLIPARQITETRVFRVLERQILPGGEKKKPAAACRG